MLVLSTPARCHAPPMQQGTVEALKAALKSNLGMSIAPDVAVAQGKDFNVPPLRPLVPATLALIENRNKSHDLVVATVRDALLDLRENAVIAPLSKRTRQVARPRVA